MLRLILAIGAVLAALIVIILPTEVDTAMVLAFGVILAAVAAVVDR